MDGTDLSEAYNFAPTLAEPGASVLAQPPARAPGSTSLAEVQARAHAQEQQHHQQPESQQQHQPRSQSRVAPQQSQRNQNAPMVYYDPRDAEVVQHFVPSPIVAPPSYSQRATTSYFDAMVQKRRDVMKMVSFAVIILLAISIHTVVDFGLKEVIMSNDFTFKQELGVRFIYPFAVVLLLWNLKALTSGGGSSRS